MTENTRYDFVKSPDCREVVVDGVHGGIGPHNRINMVVFTERNHIPANVTHARDGSGPEVGREARDGVVRIIGTVLLLDLKAAEALQAFLADRISELAAR